MKSENTLKKSKDLQGFHWYILEYSENVKWQSKCIYRLLITEIKHQTNTDQPLSSIKEEIHNLNHLVHNIEDLNYKYHGFNWNPWISQYQGWNPQKYHRNLKNDEDFRVGYCKFAKTQSNRKCKWI